MHYLKHLAYNNSENIQEIQEHIQKKIDKLNARHSIKTENEYLMNDQVLDIIHFVTTQFKKIAAQNKSFKVTFYEINKIINALNKKYKLSSKMTEFTINEFAKITYNGFESIYDNIQHQELDNLTQDSNDLKNIYIDNDFNQLDITEQTRICKFIINNINTNILRESVFEMIGLTLCDKLSECIDNFDYSRINDVVYSAYSLYSEKPLHESYLIAWLQFNMPNAYRKINNIIHNTVPIIINNFASYDDDMSINENGTDPNTWITYTDKQDPVHGLRESNIAPIYFSNIRISPLVVLDNEVLYSEDSKKHHNDLINDYKEKMNLNERDSELAFTEGTKSILEEFGAQNMAIGSLFQGKIALLEYITDGKEEEIVDENNLIRPNNGNPAAIIKSLQNKGIKKVYIQNVSPWVSREYERIASLNKALSKKLLLKTRRLMKKVLG